MDDLSGKISEFLSDPDSMNKLRGLIGMLGGPSGGDAGAPKPEEKPNPPPGPEMPFDADTLMKLTRAFSMMNKDDPKVDLLLALKPNLSEGRRQKVDEAIQLLRLINLLPMIQEGLFNDNRH